MPRFSGFKRLLWPLALALLAWVITQLPLAALARAFGPVTLSQALLWGLLNLVIALLATGRWWLFCRCCAVPIRYWPLLIVRQAGQAVSFITPGPQFGGEPLQLYWLCRRGDVPATQAVLALGLDRGFELWINFAVLAAILVALQLPAGDFAGHRQLGLVLLGAALFALPLLATLATRHRTALGHIGRKLVHACRLPASAPAPPEGFVSAGSGFDIPAASAALILSLAGWAGLLAELRLLLHLLGLPVDTASFLTVLAALRLAILLPLPGGIGTLEAGVLWAFQTNGWPAEAAAGLIALTRLRDLAVLAVGFCCLKLGSGGKPGGDAGKMDQF